MSYNRNSEWGVPEYMPVPKAKRGNFNAKMSAHKPHFDPVKTFEWGVDYTLGVPGLDPKATPRYKTMIDQKLEEELSQLFSSLSTKDKS